MNAHNRWVSALPAALLALWLLLPLQAAAEARQDEARPSQPSAAQISAGDVIERAARVLRSDSDNAMTWSEGLERLDNWPARLERAMLKLLGPAELRDLPAAIADVTALLNEQSQALELSSHARLLLTVMLTLSKREQAAQDRLDRAEKALMKERAEHDHTREKLRALRSIDEPNENDSTSSGSDGAGRQPRPER